MIKYGLIGTAAITGVWFLVESVSPLTVEPAKRAFRELASDPGQVCFNLGVDKLPNPSAAYITSSQLKGDKIAVYLKARDNFNEWFNDAWLCSKQDVNDYVMHQYILSQN